MRKGNVVRQVKEKGLEETIEKNREMRVLNLGRYKALILHSQMQTRNQ